MSFEQAPDDPVALFRRWFDEAGEEGVVQPEALALATADEAGRPCVRYVLLKGVEDGAFHFYTNLESRKAAHLERRPFAAMVFYWRENERQVRIEGLVERLDDETADAYFASRPRGSQLGAWASLQSRTRPPGALETRLAEFEKKFEGRPVPRPPHWGGYRLVPERVEFWQGKPDRLHDRLVYRRDGAEWSKDRLYP